MQGIGCRVAVLHRSPRVELGQGSCRVHQRQVLCRGVVPDVLRWRVGREFAARLVFGTLPIHRVKVALDVCRIGGKVGGKRADWQKIDQIDLAWLVGPPGVVGVFATKHHTGLRVLELWCQNQAMNVKPVVVHGVNFRCVEVNAEVAQLTVAGHLGPQDQASPGVDCLAG